MAATVSRVYLASVQHGRSEGGDTDRTYYRLSEDREQDLRDVALGVEETNAGVCCRYLVDQLAGGGGHADVDDDGYVHHLEAVERFVERYGDFGKHRLVRDWRNRMARCRRALARLSLAGLHRHVSVLHVAHGQPDPLARQFPELDSWGPLASLARYTDAVERVRLEMARAEAASRARASAYVPAAERPENRSSPGALLGGLREAVAQMGETHEIFRLAAKHAPKGTPRRSTVTREEGAVLFDLERHRGVVAHAERAISSGDALRHALAGIHGSDEDKAHRAKEKDRRAAFVLEVKLEARRMLSDAEEAYHAAWYRSAT